MKDLIGLFGLMALLLAAGPLRGSTGGTESTQPSARSTATGEQAPAKSEPPAGKDGPKELLNPPKPGDVWWMREGKGYTLCEAVYKELQRYTPRQLGVCVPAVAHPHPGMKELDGWTELDPREHEDLYKRLVQYDKVGVRSYFTGERFDEKKLDDARLDYLYQEFLKLGGRMRTNSLMVFRHPLGDLVTTYDQPQTVVELRRKTNKELCPDSPALTDMVSTFYVTADLAGPSPEIMQVEARSASNGRLVQYKGVLHLMSGTDVLAFYRDFGKGWLQSYCDYRFQRIE
jgi:hypothetical protein